MGRKRRFLSRIASQTLSLRLCYLRMSRRPMKSQEKKTAGIRIKSSGTEPGPEKRESWTVRDEGTEVNDRYLTTKGLLKVQPKQRTRGLGR